MPNFSTSSVSDDVTDAEGGCQQTDVPAYTVNEQESFVTELPYLNCKYDLIVQYDVQGLAGVIPFLCL